MTFINFPSVGMVGSLYREPVLFTYGSGGGR